MKRDELRFFDRSQAWTIADQRRLPHWLQADTLCFITWRVADSLPNNALERLDAEIREHLTSLGMGSHQDVSEFMLGCDAKARSQIHWRLFQIRDKYLDRHWGRCPLRVPAHAKIVLQSLRHFDEQRYFLTDVIVMPNHLHFIAAFGDEDAMLRQCDAWKRFTGKSINQLEKRTGSFWQPDQFDHLIRGESQFEYFRRYIQDNPKRAGLRQNEFLYWAKELTNSESEG